METEEIIAELDDINGADSEGAHSMADALLLEAVPVEVRDAYLRVRDRCDWWACA